MLFHGLCGGLSPVNNIKSGFISLTIVSTKRSSVLNGRSHFPGNPHFPAASFLSFGNPTSSRQQSGVSHKLLVP